MLVVEQAALVVFGNGFEVAGFLAREAGGAQLVLAQGQHFARLGVALGRKQGLEALPDGGGGFG